MRTAHHLKSLYAMLFGVIFIQAGAYLFTSFGVDPSGRYFLPLVIPLALFFGDLVECMLRIPPAWKWAMLGVLLISHSWGTLQAAAKVPPGLTTQFGAETHIDPRFDDELMVFLQEQGETRGYTSYWLSYPLAFNSKEELVFIPRLPYHLDFRYTARDDRYEPYKADVRASGKVAYITVSFPALDDRIRLGLSSLDITWAEQAIGPYRVFYHLSAPAEPEILGLYEVGS